MHMRVASCVQVFQDTGSAAWRLLRAFAGGVLLALALVHIMPEGMEEMDTLLDPHYPVGGATVLFGVFFMVLVENGALLFFKHNSQAGQHICSHNHSHHDSRPAHRLTTVSSDVPERGSASVDQHQPQAQIPEPIKTASHDEGGHHSHGCLGAHNTANLILVASPQSSATLRQQVCSAFSPHVTSFQFSAWISWIV